MLRGMVMLASHPKSLTCPVPLVLAPDSAPSSQVFPCILKMFILLTLSARPWGYSGV